MTPLAIVASVGAGTYLIRVSVIALAGRLSEPSTATIATLRLIAPSVLAAILANQLFVGDDGPAVDLVWLIAAAIAASAAYRFRSAGVTMLVGLAVVWLLDVVA